MLLTSGVFLLDKQLLRGRISECDDAEVAREISKPSNFKRHGSVKQLSVGGSYVVETEGGDNRIASPMKDPYEAAIKAIINEGSGTPAQGLANGAPKSKSSPLYKMRQLSASRLAAALKPPLSKIKRLKHNVSRVEVINAIAELDEEELGRAMARAARVHEEPARLMLITIQAAISVTEVIGPLMSNDCERLPMIATE